ncbi:MAG: cyclopropane-fatty-acyl-phospholipid synthase family protein [Methylotenera sp.]|uniref:SAM-dependent methyltransferase n=1 Tax=Methylotenera sp. TaxID=2051956 RepID=UPI00271B93CB|nr:cyclopropane-fatty-acyl-phospholipid synthase family protein [Methylotenera sp.]MDO9205911.1 cyclopropane-fatty-acyl-phospholipid synthase family protein [Methylotenera sp.]MDO9393441.1 cyclopropane-fatty-acyl-phospholipid synthase family protein [Methylotenera sp.]MDP1523954.1 cyclopropane-fatty-acyl-phospholipid synthase family protein [Methylotenera sp.]MDP3817490.1 cyclopropane-fatty-acyl-phospholipid synthase family protein [Methylotenera sp.]
MSISVLQQETLTSSLKEKSRAKWVARFAKSQILSHLGNLQAGRLTLVDGNENYFFGNPSHTLHAIIHVHDQRFYGEIAFGGSIGAGEAYMLGYWSADNLTNVIRLMCINQSVMDNLEGGYQWLTKPIMRVLHWLNSNTTEGSRKNIAAHYDLGNEMFQLFLDPTMMYSSAMFTEDTKTLQQASELKLKTICNKLKLKPTDHVLEIGTGWGGFSIYAAKNYGCKITTTTISEQQHQLAKEMVEEAGLSDKITLLLDDYRHLSGQFDKLVSIEMIEAVGYQFYDTYFSKVSSLLKPEGLALIQAITIADQRYESAKKSVDFIQRYIFPGSCIPSNTAMLNSITNMTDMRLVDLEDIGPHYATTLRMWRENFFTNIEQISKLGYSQEFIKMWEFYFCYCEGGFEERALGDMHLLLAKPFNRSVRLRV